MQISKTLLTIGALAFCAVTVLQAAPDTEVQAKAREALRKKVAELTAAPAVATDNRVATPEQIQHSRDAVRQKILELNQQDLSAEVPVFADSAAAGRSRATPEQLDRARESVRLRIAELNKRDQVRPAPAATGLSPIPTLPSPLPATKEARLAELLTQYKADAISPTQYHTERAKILAEP